jgi:hypothetical protein
VTGPWSAPNVERLNGKESDKADKAPAVPPASLGR